MEQYTANDLILGRSYQDWTRKWWEWWCTPSKMPMHSENVDGITLVTTKAMERYDTSLFKTTDNKASRGNPLLFPVDKWLSVGFAFATTDQQLKDIATWRMGMLTKVDVTIDGKKLTPTSIQTEPFNLTLGHDIMYPEVGGTDKIVKGKYRAVGDGYWIFLKPNVLEVGHHLLEAQAGCQTGVLTLNAEHLLEVIE